MLNKLVLFTYSARAALQRLINNDAKQITDEVILLWVHE